MVNRLVGVAHRKNVAVRSRETRKNLNLGEVRVLKFIGENEPGPRPRLRQNLLIVVQQGMCASDHVAEGAEILLPQPAFHRAEYPGNLAAAAKHFSIVENILGFRNPRDRNFPALQPLQILLILFRRHQFVMAPVYKLQQITQELAQIRGPRKMLQP